MSENYQSSIDVIPVGEPSVDFLSQLSICQPGPFRQNAIRESEWVKVSPTSAVTPSSNIFDFLLPQASDSMFFFLF